MTLEELATEILDELRNQAGGPSTQIARASRVCMRVLDDAMDEEDAEPPADPDDDDTPDDDAE